MKSFLLKILGCLLLPLFFCQCIFNTTPVPQPESPWWLIIKFKDHKYEEYIMPSSADNYGFDMCHDYHVCLSDVLGINPYIGLPKDYVFVDHKWNPTYNFLNSHRKILLLPWSDFTEYPQHWPPETPSQNDVIENAYIIYSQSLSEYSTMEYNSWSYYTCDSTKSWFKAKIFYDSIQTHHVEIISSMLESDDFEKEMNNNGVTFKRVSL